jgi:tetratricopeptide (TPR) repeat protein
VLHERSGGFIVKGLSRAVFFSLILGANACGDKIDPDAEAAKLKSDLEEASARLRNHRVEDAEKIYLRILEKYPNLPEAEFGMALVRFAENDLESTEVLLKRVVTAMPDNHKVQAKLGHLYFLTERHAESATHYQKAFELESDNGEYGLAYGVGLKNSKQYPEAEAVLRKVAELDPMVRFVYTELGDVVRAQNRLDEALKIYMKAQNTYASDKKARAGAAFIYES